MRTVRESARDVPVIADVDVLVIGSGPGGLGAALAAARAGANTMLVERFGCLGGNITVVGVESDVGVGNVQTELLRQGVRIH